MKLEHVILAGALVTLGVAGCGGDDDQMGPGAGRAAAGRAGNAGKPAGGKGGKANATGGSGATGGSAPSGGKGGTTGGSGGTSGGSVGAGATGGTSPNAGESGMSGAAGTAPACVDFSAVVSDLIENHTADDSEPVALEDETYCTDAEDPHAFDALF